MPSNKNALTRIKLLDSLLQNRYHNYNLDDLTNKVNEGLFELGIEPVTRRCIEKDIEYIEGKESPFEAEIERYTIPVSTQSGTTNKHCLRYEDKSFSIFKQQLSNEEKYLLSQALNTLGQFEGLPNLEQLSGMSNIAPKMKRQVVSFSKNPIETSNLFGQLFNAITQKSVIKLTYKAFVDSEEKSIQFHPYILKEYNRRWYVLGIDNEDKKALIFALDRIQSIQFDANKYIEYKGQFDEWFDDIIGVTKYETEPIEHVLFWVSNKSNKYVQTKPLHESQKCYKNDVEYRKQYPSLLEGNFFSIDCCKNYELIRELTSYGPELLVLSPKRIRDEVAERVNEMTKQYELLRKMCS